MQQKIRRKFLVLFMALAVMMPNVVQIVEVVAMSESEEEAQVSNGEMTNENSEAETVVEVNEPVVPKEGEQSSVAEGPDKEENSDDVPEEIEHTEKSDVLDSKVAPINVTLNNIEFNFSGTDANSTATVVSYSGTDRSVTIPAQVLNTAAGWTTASPVTIIGESAFRSKNLTSISIPNSVTRLEFGSLQNNSLTSIAIPNSITYIGDYALAFNNFANVTIPSSVTNLGNYAFISNRLTHIGIPGSVTSLGNNVFSNNQLTSVTIPSSVTNLGNYAFSNNQLTSVTIPSSVTNLGNYVFSNNQLTSVTIPSSVTSMGNNVFAYNQLTSVTIPSSITSLGNAVFAYNQLTSVTIPSSVTSMGNLVFLENQLTSVTIPGSITSLGGFAFANNQLTSVTIPDSVTSLDESAFANNQLTSVTIPSSITSLRGFVFANNQLTSVTIPDSVTSLGNGVFANNQLASVTISNNVTSIGLTAFSGNPLKYIETNVENIDILRSHLNFSTIDGVSERTILRALDYEIGTEEKRSAIVGQAVDYAISQQYRIRSTSNLVWDMYSPEVQWEKDGNFLEEESYKSLVFENVQETDSGVYRAVVDGITLSGLQLQVNPELEPDIPSIDPNEVSVSPENVNPSVEGLSIRYISNIRFNSAPFSLLDQTLRLEDEPMITIQDMRPREERSGWELLVSMDSTFMNGAEIVMNPFIHQENQTNLLVEGVSELILNDEPQRFAGTTMIEEPNPFGILSMGMGSGENPMLLRVPGKTGVKSYETTVHWQLVTGP